MIHEPSYELAPTLRVVRPAHELLQDPELAAETWPELANEADFLSQIAEHKEHVRVINDALNTLQDPTMTLTDAVRSNHITAQQATELYTYLTELLDDPDYGRLVLYIPFRWMPRSGWMPRDKNLAEAATDFRESYNNVWHEQIPVLDVRANFVDGDVLETELREGDLPRVSKAAHLIPKLIKHGMITMSEVQVLLKNALNPTVRKSIQEAMAAMTDPQNFVTEPAEDSNVTVITPSRQRWLGREANNRLIEEKAKNVSKFILKAVGITQMPPITPSGEQIDARVWIEGLLKAIKSNQLNKAEAQDLLERHRSAITELGYDTNEHTRGSFIKLFLHARSLGLIDKSELQAYEIDRTTLSSPLSENLKYMDDAVESVQEVVRQITADVNLYEYIYPVVGLGGSRLKGYGDRSSDIDTCVYIRPGVNPDVKTTLRRHLAEAFAKAGLPDVPIELWLEESSEGLVIGDATDPHMGDKYWAHLLFDNAWVGEADAVETLQKQLLPTYFFQGGVAPDGNPERQLYLERLEQDMLQYRLLHRGYDRHFPRVNKGNVGVNIDGDSAFWDEGYRRLATQLFISTVFLPKL